MQTRT